MVRRRLSCCAISPIRAFCPAPAIGMSCLPDGCRLEVERWPYLDLATA
jgi:hypothetical protein